MVACILITTSALIQLLLTVWYRKHMRYLRSLAPELLASKRQHSTWIVLSVRGADPTLASAMNSLLNQDYRNYRVCVVVDNEDDPATKVLNAVVEDFPDDRLVIRHLQNPLSNCTLKCSAIAEGVEYILNSDPKAQYLVMVDADSRPPANMMATLVGALQADTSIGLVSGNQWFEPNVPATAGSIVRSMWYAGALFFSMLFQNPWAGAYAMRTRDIRRIGLLDVWRKSAVDDGPLKALLARHGLACQSLPSMVIVNRESCTLGFVKRWMSRILTWSRIHEFAFWLTALQMTFATSLIIFVFSTLGWAIYTSNSLLVIWCVVAIVASGVMSVLAWTTIRRSVIETSNSAGDIADISLIRFMAALLLVAVAQAVYCVSCLTAIFARTVTWRGVSYSIENRNVVLKQYVPYDGKNGSRHSI